MGTYIPYLSNLMGVKAPAGNYSVGGGAYSGHLLYYIYRDDIQKYGLTRVGTHAALKDADLITLEGSINDFASSVPLGTVNDTAPYSSAEPTTENQNSTNNFGGTTDGTFAGCVYTAITKLREINPTATIVLITDNAGTGSCAADKKNSLGLYPHDYTDMVIAVANRLNCPVIDAGRTAGFENHLDTYLSDHIHHSAAGGEAYANAIWVGLQEIAASKAQETADAQSLEKNPAEPVQEEPAQPTYADSQDYFWDFTDVSYASGSRMSSVPGGNWAENSLTYKNLNDADKAISISSSGITNGATGYFVFDKDITLPRTNAWTIEWQGSVNANSIMMVQSTTGTPTNSNQLYITVNYPTSGYTGVYFYPRSSDCALQVPNSVASNSSTRWYIMNDGTGKVTISVIAADGTLYSNSNLTIRSGKDSVDFNKLFGCYDMASSDRRALIGTVKYVKIYHSFNEEAAPAAQIGDTKYLTLNKAIEAATSGSYESMPEEATTIKLLRDVSGGFDVGTETGSLETYGTQNIVLDLNNKTLTLGDPAVASGELKNKGIRVLAHSKLSVKNGTCRATIRRGLATSII